MDLLNSHQQIFAVPLFTVPNVHAMLQKRVNHDSPTTSKAFRMAWDDSHSSPFSCDVRCRYFYTSKCWWYLYPKLFNSKSCCDVERTSWAFQWHLISSGWSNEKICFSKIFAIPTRMFYGIKKYKLLHESRDCVFNGKNLTDFSNVLRGGHWDLLNPFFHIKYKVLQETGNCQWHRAMY